MMQQEKPYDVCLACHHLGKTCDGPNFLAMTTERWVEWCLSRKKILNVTNSQIADGSNVPKGTVDRVISGHGGDLRITTMRDITRFLVNGTWGQFPCADPYGVQASEKDLVERIKEQDAAYAELQTQLQELQEIRKKDLENAHAEERRKLDFLKEQLAGRDRMIRRKERTAAILGAVIGVLALMLIGLLLYDLLDPTIGYVRY